MTWLVDLVLRLFGLWLNRTPPVIAEAEKAGGAEARLADRAAADAEVEVAVRAARGSASGGLRDPADPDCRDCGT